MVKHRHAVVRDLNSLGFHGDTPVWAADLVSCVLASQQGTAVRYAVDEGWPQTDHLLANLGEQQARMIDLPTRYQRPGMATAAPDPGPVNTDGSPRLSPQSLDEFRARRARDKGRDLSATERDAKIGSGSRKAEGVKSVG